MGVLSRPTTTDYTWTSAVFGTGGGNSRTGVKWTITDLTGGGILAITGCSVVNLDGAAPTIVVDAGSGVWEYAIQLVANAGADASANFYGNGHGFEGVLAAPTLVLGGVTQSLSVGQSAYGDALVISQSRSILLPADGVTVAGSSTITHTFNDTSLRVDHAHNYNAGFKICDSGYNALAPINGPTFDRVQMGYTTPRTALHDDSVRDNVLASYGVVSSSVHPYALRMTLPTGLPRDDGVGWTQDTGLQLWWQDRVAGPKMYCNYVSFPYNGGARGRAVAVNTSHSTVYQLLRRFGRMVGQASRRAP